MLVMVFFLGLTPEHPAHFIGAIYLTSFAYISIVSLLVIVLDNPGRFLAMVLLVLQLGSSEEHSQSKLPTDFSKQLIR